MRNRKGLAGIAAVGLLAAMALAACSDDGGDDDGDTGGSGGGTASWDDCADNPNTCNGGEPVDGGQIVWAVEQQQETWNLNTSTGNTFVLEQMLQGVVPDTGRFLPDGTWAWNLDLLAAPAELTSEEPQTWVYEISPDAKWSDGTDITAEDFIFQWRHNAGNPDFCTACDPPSSAGFNQIESVVGSNGGKTVTVTLREGEKFAEWPYLFGNLYPSHLAAAQGFDLTTPEGMQSASEWFGSTQIAWSGGPYVVAEADLSQQMILEPNEAWYGETQPTLEQVIFRIITDQPALLTAMQNGEIDGASPQPNPDMVQQIGALPGVIDHVGFGYQWEHIDLNLTNEWLSDVELRKAIFTAIDVNDINARTFASFAPDISQKTNFLFKEGSEYFQDVITPTGQGAGDTAAAMDILTAAGYELVDGTLMLDGEQVGPLRFVHTEGNQLRATTGELVQSYLSELGIEVTIETTADLGGTLTEGDFDLIVFAWVGSPTFQTSGDQFWHSESDSNYGNYSNEQVDSLVREAVNQSDLDEVGRLLNEAATIVAQEAYSLPIADKPVYAFVSDDYLNIRPNFTNSGVPYNVGEWGLATAP